MMPHIESQAQRDALIEYCKENLAILETCDVNLRKSKTADKKHWLAEHQIQRLSYQITLAALEAEPRTVFRCAGCGFEMFDEHPSSCDCGSTIYIRGVTYTAQPVPVLKPVDKSVIREVFMRNGFTIKEGHHDLKDYVFSAAFELLSEAGYPISGEDNETTE